MRVTTYTSSSGAVDARYRDVARAYGAALATAGHELVYGGTAVGLMAVMSAAVRDGGGRVTGVLPRLMVERGLGDDDCDELVVTDGMSGRKQVMIERADAFVALPGGFGTLEELLEVVTLKQLGYHDRPIVLLDADGFWQPLLATFERFFELGFADRSYTALYHVAPDVDDLLDHLATYTPTDLPTKRF